jgi:hypothetical protein
MRKTIEERFFAGLVLLLLAAVAHATPVNWALHGVTFSDGGTATGSFIYDADTNQFSAISITTTTGSALPGATFTYVCTSPCVGLTPSSANGLFLTAFSSSDQTGKPGVALFFSPNLSNAGGNVVVGGLQGICTDAVCTSPGSVTRTVTAGAATGLLPPVALPALSLGSLTLLVAALCAVAFRFRRRMRREPV